VKNFPAMAETGDVDILLVEDDPNDAELTQRAFRKSDLDVRLTIVRDGAEALDYLFGGKPRPKVVLLDLKLPKIDGIDVLRRIRAGERTRTIPVVVLTSSQEERDIVECYELGANSYVVKPVDFDRFYRTVSDIGAYWLVLNKLPI